MGIQTGTVTGQSIESNNGSSNVRMLQVQLLGDSPETVEFFNVSGEDTAPAGGDKVIVFDLGDGFKFSLATKDLVVATMLAGEKKLYSQDGTIKAFINLLIDGVIELNGNNDFAVRYNALQTAFDELKSAFNGHTHSGVTSGGSSTGPAAPQSAADITTAKVDEVKII